MGSQEHEGSQWAHPKASQHHRSNFEDVGGKKTKKGQQGCLQTILTLVTQKGDEGAVFFRKCLPLSSGTSFKWEFAELENEKAAQLQFSAPLALEPAATPKSTLSQSAPSPACSPEPPAVSGACDIDESDDEM